MLRLPQRYYASKEGFESHVRLENTKRGRRGVRDIKDLVKYHRKNLNIFQVEQEDGGIVYLLQE